MSELWCIRVPGPDDVFAMANKEAAEAAVVKHNEWITDWYENEAKKEDGLKLLPTLENMKAVVELWPWNAKAHAESLADQ